MPYRERLTRTRVIAFDALDVGAREAFVRAVRGVGGTPVLLASDASRLGQPARWLGLAAFGGAVVVMAAIPGWGELVSLPLLDGWLLAYVLGAIAFVAGVTVFVGRALVLRGLPFPPGIYVLPTLLVDARGPMLRLRPLADLDPNLAVAGQDGRVVLSFSDGEAFSFPTTDSPEEVRRQLEGFLEREVSAEAMGDEDSLRLLRPLPVADFDAIDDRRGPTIAMATRRRVRSLLLLSAGAGCLLGIGGRVAREHLSERLAVDRAHVRGDTAALWEYVDATPRLRSHADRALVDLAGRDDDTRALLKYLRQGTDKAAADRLLFQRASKQDTMVAFESYLEVGTLHRAEAEARLLDLARRSNSRMDFERYLAVASRDADLVRRKLLPEADLAAAREPRQVLDLRAYLQSDVDPAVKDVVRGRIDKLYAAELARYDDVAAQRKHRKLVVRMLGRLAEGKKLVVDVAGSTEPGFDVQVERFLARNGSGVSPKTYLGQTEAIEGVLRLSAAHGLHRVFDEHVVPVVADGEEPAARLVVRYRVRGTDVVWLSADLGRAFLSLRVTIEVGLRVPGEQDAATGQVVFEADRLWYRRNTGRTPYTRMIENAAEVLEREVERMLRE